MEMEMLSPVPHSWWYSYTLLFLVVYPFVGTRIASRGDFRLAVLLPLVVGVNAACIGVCEVVGALAIHGVAPVVAAAGAAETAGPIRFGALSALASSLYLALRRRPCGVWRRDGVSLALTVAGAVLLLSYAAVGWSITQERVSYVPSQRLATAALRPAATILTIGAAAALAISMRRSEAARVTPRAWLLSFAAASALLFLAARFAAGRLQSFIMSQ